MLIDQKIPLGQYIASFVEWLTQNGANYFDAIAQAEIKARKPNAARSPGADGVTIRTMINALIQTDSQLLAAPQTRAKAQLTPQHVDTAAAAATAKFIHGRRTTPISDKIIAASRIAAR